MFTQLGNGGQNFVVAYASQYTSKVDAKYNLCEGNCFIVVWAISSF
jgi:hypothetical protein